MDEQQSEENVIENLFREPCLSNDEYLIKLGTMLWLGIRVIEFETEYTKHYIEVRGYSDRGTLLWHAETKLEPYERDVGQKKAARTSHIDGADFFPRIYFLKSSLCEEIAAWLNCRGLTIISLNEWKDQSINNQETENDGS